jgi:phosphatidylglycerophosphate synthase
MCCGDKNRKISFVEYRWASTRPPIRARISTHRLAALRGWLHRFITSATVHQQNLAQEPAAQAVKRRNVGGGMLDGLMRKLIDPPLNAMGRQVARRGVSADAITVIGLILGLIAAGVIALGWSTWLALVPLLASRVADGLDGAVARATKKTDFGGFLDIGCDFLFYGAIPLAFVLRDTSENGMAGAFLLMTFYANGATFLAYAILAEKRGMQTAARGQKSLYFTAGLLEGTETIVFFVALCLWPWAFAPLSWAFGALCLATALARVMLARRVFR